MVAMAHGLELRIWRRLSSLHTFSTRLSGALVDRSLAYAMRCSTEGSTGVVLSDLRNVERPGACIAAPCAMWKLYIAFWPCQLFPDVYSRDCVG